VIDRELAFRTLEVEPGASQEQIRAAYRTLARVWHPDRLGSDPKLRRHAEEKLKQINAAYELLCQDDGVRVPPPPDSPPSPRDGPDEPRRDGAPVGVRAREKGGAERRPPPANRVGTRKRELVSAIVLVIACLSVGLALYLSRSSASAPGAMPEASLPAPATAPRDGQIGLPTEFSKEFRGTIGSRTGLLVRFTRRGSDVFGMYTWVDANHVPTDRQIAVRGRIETDGRMRLTEYRNFLGESEAASGLFEGQLTVDAISKHLLFAGEWRSAETASGLECRLVERRFDLPAGVELVSKRAVSEYSDPDIRVDLEYPQLASTNDDAVGGFNRLVQGFAESAASEFVTSLQEEDGPSVSNAPLGSSYDLRYDVLYAREGILSIRFEVEAYSEGAVHQQFAYDELTFNVGSGQRLSLRNLFKPGVRYLETLSRYCEADPRIQSVLNNDLGLRPVADNFRVWNITVDGLLITFPPYQIGSFADGTQRVTVPFHVFGDTLASEALQFRE
jgi:hypothetical protein